MKNEEVLGNYSTKKHSITSVFQSPAGQAWAGLAAGAFDKRQPPPQQPYLSPKACTTWCKQK